MSRPKSSVLGLRPTASSTWEPVTSGGARRALKPDGDFSAPGLEADAFRLEVHGDAFGFENLLNRGRDILILTRDQPRRHLHDGHLSAEAAVHLCELKADIAAADDDQMPRQRVELENRRVGQGGDTVDSRQVRNARAAADIDEDVLRGERSMPTCTSRGERKRAWPR